MNKVICDICGTSYSESAEQCPICGYSRDFKVEPLADDEEFLFDDMLMENAEAETAEKPVEEILAAETAAEEEDVMEDTESEEEESSIEDVLTEEEGKPRRNGFLIAILVILIIALLGVTGYIFTRYYLPGMRADATEPAVESTVDETEDLPAPTIPCTSLAMTSDSEVLLEQAGNHWNINVVAMPEDTTDEIIFVSNNLDVVTVDADGTVTAVGEGSAVVTVLCGEFSVDCNVTCAFVEEPSVPDVSPTTEPEETEEENDDGQIQPVVDEEDEETEAAETTAAPEAETEVATEAPTEAPTEAETEAPTEAETEAPTEAPTEAATEPADGLVLKLNKSDISFDRVGVYYTLKVTDGIDPKDVEWSTSHSGVCVVEDGVITITGRGIAKITAKYKGQEVTCIVRVSG